MKCLKPGPEDFHQLLKTKGDTLVLPSYYRQLIIQCTEGFPSLLCSPEHDKSFRNSRFQPSTCSHHICLHAAPPHQNSCISSSETSDAKSDSSHADLSGRWRVLLTDQVLRHVDLKSRQLGQEGQLLCIFVSVPLCNREHTTMFTTALLIPGHSQTLHGLSRSVPGLSCSVPQPSP